jgi:uncharacterized transporter YbjL
MFELFDSRYEVAADWLASLSWPLIVTAIVVLLAVNIIRRRLARVSLRFLRKVCYHFDIELSAKLGNSLRPGLELFIFSLGMLAALEISWPHRQFGDNLKSLAISVIVASLIF